LEQKTRIGCSAEPVSPARAFDGKVWRTDRQTDGWTDGQTDVRTGRRRRSDP